MTQQERILNYILKFGSISPMEAFRDLGVTKLSTRIGEINRTSTKFLIEGNYEETKNRFGEKVRYKRYRFV